MMRMDLSSARGSVAILAFGMVAGCGGTAPSDEEHVEPGSAGSVAASRDWEKSFLEKDDEKEDGAECSGVRVPDRSGFRKKIALTFDDGPNAATTPTALAILRRHNVPATFFINGVRVTGATERALIREVASDPLFVLANHSWSHRNLAKAGRTTVTREMDDVTPLISGTGEPHRYFRFPYGSSTCSTAKMARDRSYRITGWHIDSADWCFAAGRGYCSPSTFAYVPSSLRRDMKGLVLKQAREYGGGVVLMHDIHKNTVDNLEAIILALKAEGFTFTSLEDGTTFPLLNGSNGGTPLVPSNPWIGDRCATDADCAFNFGSSRGRCHRAKFCTLTCEGTCPDLDGKAGTFCAADPGISPAAGICVSKVSPKNNSCSSLPGTRRATATRFGGSTGIAARSAEVCLPN